MTATPSIIPPVSGLGAVLVSAFLLAGAQPSGAAACGLHCLRAQSVEAPGLLELGASLRRSALEHAGAPGTYSEFGLEARYRSGAGWAAGLQWPLVVLEYAGAVRTGMGNPMGFAEYRIPAGTGFRLDLGAQMGLPLGNTGDGLAGDRFMGALYAALTRAGGYLEWSAALGLSAMLPPMEPGHAHGGEGASAGPVGMAIGSPHENLEGLYRLGAEKKLWNDRAGLSLVLDGQHVLSKPMDPESGRDFLILETGAAYFSGTAVIAPALLIPVSPDRRLDWALVLRGSVGI